ncbi:ribosome assembly factor SBDS [Candidatus Pacearchaeota archaeon CG10_big_fil_rev_8_21_14_0_10_32_42]|nr:MAG: ribosome assembly factor SBDS [Candidatus Pacearchaeota archaeon CG10_big_fil_rev_8_21_14_0_10_32_42]
MTDTTARLKKAGMDFEILVDLDEALKFKKGLSDFLSIGGDRIFRDLKKGNVASKDDLEIAFKTTNVDEIGKIIIKQGEVLTDQEHRDEEKEKRVKQVVDFLSKNAIDAQTGNPLSPGKIKTALEQASILIKNAPIDSQIKEILEKLSLILPIKIETKKIRILVPAIQTGRVYGLLTQYKEKENWLNDGSLEVVVSIPAGITLEFYDKLNSMTHGSAITEEIK